MHLCVLDYSPIISGHTAADAIAATLDLVQETDEVLVLTVAPDYAARLRSHALLAATLTATAVA